MNWIKRITQFGFILGLTVALLASCKQDRYEPNPIVQEDRETIIFSLSAEVSVDDSELRAIDYKLGKNADGKTIPMPQFSDGQLVDVHTIIKSSSNVSVAKTLKWRYDAQAKKLVISEADGHSIKVANFNNDDNVQWYISGLIGGTLDTNAKTVFFQGTRELTGVQGSEGDVVGSLEVPYAFGWTELSINTSGERDAEGSYRSAKVLSSANLKFSPLGSLIAYKLGNQQTGAYTFAPSGFTVSTNAFGDQGTFNLDTELSSSRSQSVLPSWIESAESSNISYRFAHNQAPGAIANKQTASKTYYAWVMPHTVQPTTVSTHVTMMGETSRISSKPLEIFSTDYKVKTSRLAQGKIYTLRANVTTGRPLLPIDYVTDYNLAGGEGWTYTTTNMNPQPDGVLGPLRFAASHRNDQSGYYNWYQLVGRKHNVHNPNGENLQEAIDATLGMNKYVVPTSDQWWGIYPSRPYYYFSTDTVTLNVDDVMALGSNNNLLRQSYKSDYSKGFSEDYANKDAIVYAIRFKKRQIQEPVTFASDYDPASNTKTFHAYSSSPDDFLKCAYRYTRVGGRDDWNLARPAIFHPNPSLVNANLTNRLVVDVVYLGEEATPTSLNQISNAQWWNDKKAKGLVISRTFPAAGVVKTELPESAKIGTLVDRGGWSTYWSSSMRDLQSGRMVRSWTVDVNLDAVYGQFGWIVERYNPWSWAVPSSLPVRLFYKDPRSN